MNQRKVIQSTLFCAFLLGTTIQAEINHPENTSLTASKQAQMAELADFAEDVLVKAFGFLQKIENKLTEIALLAKKGSFKIAVNPTKIMEVLTENKMTINALLQSQATIIALKDPIKHLEVTFVISEFCNAFIPYLDQQIKDNFKNAKPFNFKQFLKNLNKDKNRSNFNHLEPASLTKQINITHSKLQSLDSAVQNIGLTWYNKAARTLDSYVVTPANKYHVPTIACYGGGIALFSLYSLWKFGDLLQNNPNIPASIRTFIEKLHANNCGPLADDRTGRPYIVGGSNMTWNSRTDSFSGDIPTNACTLAVTDYAITKFMLQTYPLGALAAASMLGSFVEAWKKNIYPELIKKRDNAWNFLRGGEYLNTFRPGLTQLKPTVSFKDMVGLDEVKEAFYSIIQYIDNPEQLMRIEATPEKGWLLTGPPRTGKTFSVECLCGEIELMMEKRGLANKMKFFNIHAALINEYGIKAILDEVSENAPAVVFIDEIDLLGLQRIGNNKLLSDFLTTMQRSMNADPSKIVIVIAATNRPENIDSALRQNGRFGKEIRFDYPAKKYRAKFLVRELSNMALNVKDFDVETLTNKTNNKTFEDLKRVIRNAMTRSWIHGVSLTQELLEESIDTEIHNLILFSRKELPENEIRIVATHFAGKALAAMHFETHEQLDKITTHAYMADLKDEAIWENYSKKDEKDHQKKIEYGAFISKQSHDTINAKNETLILNEATVLLAGFAAEELLLGPCGFTCHRNDRDKAYKLIEELVFGGLIQETLPKSVREELKTKAFTLLKQCHANVMQLLKEHQAALLAIIEELMKKQILNDKEIQAIIDTAEGKIAETIDTPAAAEEKQLSPEPAV
jgi:ATP-dependent Zn protease